MGSFLMGSLRRVFQTCAASEKPWKTTYKITQESFFFHSDVQTTHLGTTSSRNKSPHKENFHAIVLGLSRDSPHLFLRFLGNLFIRGRESNTNSFFSNFSGTPVISRQNPGICRQKNLLTLRGQRLKNFKIALRD